MTDVTTFEQSPERCILEAMKNTRAVMLGNPAQGRTFQPMSPQVDVETGEVFFFASKDADIVQGVQDGAQTCTLILVSKDFDLFASIEGELGENPDPDTMDKFWTPTTAAWFEKGRDDPKLTLLQFKPSDAAAWASSGDPYAFAWQIAKANLTEDTPNVGARATARFAA